MNNNPVRYNDPTGHQATNDDGGTQSTYDQTQYDRQRIAQERCQAGQKDYCSYAQNHPYETVAFAVIGLVGTAVLAEEVAPVAIDDMLAASEASTVLNYTPVDLALSGEYDAYGNVFYSGARETAESWASANGGVTLGQTPEGQILAETTRGLDYATQTKPLWTALSQEFAANASGAINVFLKAGGLTTGSIWATVEYPTLLNNPLVTSISIYFH